MDKRLLKIVADENIAELDAAFSSIAEIKKVGGRNLSKEDLDGANALLVRSVTKVDQKLLAGTSIEFVGSATIGTDHVDLKYLSEHAIRFCHAPGSNADSVADYLCSALAVIGPDFSAAEAHGLSAGIIGLGAVGSRLAARLEALGYLVVAHDPFLESAEVPLQSLEQVLGCDVVSLNVPLTVDGKHSTRHLLNAESLKKLSSCVTLLNTSRGPVIDGTALRAWLQDNPGARAVLDVWEGEPEIDTQLVDIVSLATAHIAGYAQDGKIRGTSMLADEFSAHFGRVSDAKGLFSEPGIISLLGSETLNEILLQAYDIRADDRLLRASVRAADSGIAFDRLRKNYATRREYSAQVLRFESEPPAAKLRTLRALGFKLAAESA